MTTTVRIARTTEVTTFDPVRYNDRGTGEVLNRMFSHLLVTDSAGGYGYGSLVAEAVETRLGDRVRHSLRLRDDARWHDGRPVTAHDVAFTIRRVLDPALDSPRRPEVLTIGADLTVRCPTARVVELEFVPEGHAGLRALAWLPVLPEHHYGAGGGDPFAVAPLGSGEFRFATRDPADGTIELVANRDHWAPPRLDGARWRRYRDAGAAVDAVLAGAEDIATAVTPAAARSVAGHPGVRVHTSSDGSCVYLGYQTATPVLREPALRTALSMAIDRRKLVAETIAGQGRPATTIIHPDSRWHCGDVFEHRYDPMAAADRLGRLGWRLDGTAVRRDGAGRPLTLSLLTVAGDEVKLAAAELIASQLADVGVRVRVDALPIGELLREHVYPGRFEAVLLALNPGPSPSFLRGFYHSGENGATNRFRYADPAVDRMLDALPPLDDEAAAVEPVRAVQRAVALGVPHTPLFHPDVVDVASAALRMPPLTGLYTNRFTDLHRWAHQTPAPAR
ncbi:ABC-type transport system substrate-binding protein [Asanoa ferruginea]|uniref:ABC-type transport system substrate-binding protein n=1 Tax=Asanoa ferruginea TaxID=53367 RepID=A0A3D9ZYH8_9ACTN|nr:ABC transporter substrate-binding protein [Asanoa ferruginea]REF98880.1 ABC-type transport system substrate-binding protein [Asanoa ferruginea]GIF46438.1 peptide ABC transporter substrate-binding protein [Asanoa ferruginea]